MLVLLGCVLLGVLFYLWDKHRRLLVVEGITRKCVLVTGCDSGFGRALARRLDAKGVTVFAGCLTPEGATSLSEGCTINLKTVIMDLTKHEDIVAAYNTVKASVPVAKEFWGVVNNAGFVGPGGPVEFFRRADYQRVLEVNLVGTADVTTTFLPLIKKSRGRIVNTSSVEGFVARTFNSAYMASKFAVYGWSDGLRREKKPWGIKVSTVEPGFFKTNVCDVDTLITQRKKLWDNAPQDVREEYGEDYILASLDREHIAKAVEKMSNKNLDLVVDAYEHALFAQHPKSHYLVGKDAKIAGFLNLLPACVMDFIISRLPIGRHPKCVTENKK